MHDPIQLDPAGEGPPAPSLPGAVVVRDDIEELTESLAADLLIHAHNCVRSFGDFHIAVSGGDTPVPLYRRLMIDPKFRDLPWKRTHLWFVDERPVPFDHGGSNFRTVNEFLGDHSDIPREQFHPIFAMSPDGADRYEQELRETLLWREKGQDRLDFALLGLGTDGAIAGLTPHSPAVLEGASSDRLVRANPDRVTMTHRLLNASRFVAVLVTGGHKTEAIRAAADEAALPHEQPARALAPVGGMLRWYLDASACPPPPPPPAPTPAPDARTTDT